MNNMKEKCVTYLPVAATSLVFSAILYSMMMTQQLTNTFDGLWHQNYLHAGDAETTFGRWLLRFIDKVSMGLHADPIISLAALSAFVLGWILILDLFHISSKRVSVLCAVLFLSSTAVSNILSYRFTSFGYGAAFFLSVFSIYALIQIRTPVAAVIVSGISLGLCMACYQAFLGVFCLIVVYYLIFLCICSDISNDDWKRNVSKCVFRTIFAVFVAALFYSSSLSFFLKTYHLSLSDYNEAATLYSSGFMTRILDNFLKAYRFFFYYFFRDTLLINRLGDAGIFYLFFALMLFALLAAAVKSWRMNRWRAVLLILLAVLIPVACNAYMLIAGSKLELQMTAGLASLIPLTMMLVFSGIHQVYLRRFCALLCALLIYGSSMQVWFDQEAMYEGRNACETMATQILNDLNESGLLSTDKEYCFIGVPARNEFFSTSDIYSCANGYAQMGNFWVSGSCCQFSYRGLINGIMGFNIPMSMRSYEEFADNSTIAAMPKFPHDGYISAIDEHTIVIKVSEYEQYTGNSKYQ